MKITTMTLEKQILDKIKTDQLRPTPRGVFFARDMIVWALVGVFVAALSLGFAMTLFMIRGTDFGLFEKLGLSTSEKVFYSIPYFWIAVTIAVALIAFLNFRNTRRGYRTTAKQFALMAAVVALAFGSLIYALDIAKYVDKTASANFPIYNSIVPLNTNAWLDPSHGLLSGAVRERVSPSDFMLRDANAILWHVTGSNITIKDGFEWASGDRIKVIGVQIGVDEFRAIEIRPWEERPVETISP